MRLLQLKANKASFKTVKFNPVGISLIVGKRNDNNYQSHNRKSTYNSVGKSLTIALVHFCLGSNKNTEFEEKIPDWVFSLDFEIENQKYTVTRSCDNQNIIFLNEEELKLNDFRKELEKKVFKIPEKTKFLTFRSLISRFIRPQRSSYNSYDNFLNKEEDYSQLLNNAFLLGLDTNYISQKHELKESLDKVDELRKNVENDTIFKKFFEEDKDLGITITDLKQKISRLEKNIIQFKVAEDYYQIVKEADELKKQLKQYENKAASIRIAISNIEKSLNIQPDIPKKKVIDLYKEAQITLNDLIIKQLEDVEEFNKKLLDNRSLRLFSEKKKFEKELKDLDGIIKNLGNRKDEKLEYLNTRGALDEYAKLNEQLSDYKSKFDKLELHRKLLNEYKINHEEIKKEFSSQNIETSKYLTNNELLIEKNILLFKSFAEQFYENKRAGIEILNNDGINKKRFEIDAKIEDDKGDGVNYVKIFCFDWTILKAKHNHSVNFIFHDSRLLSEIDTNQVVTLFQVAYESCNSNNLQYIISSNQNIIDNLKKEFSEEEFKTIIEENIILELTDESEKGKLLGLSIDLDYDKE